MRALSLSKHGCVFQRMVLQARLLFTLEVAVLAAAAKFEFNWSWPIKSCSGHPSATNRIAHCFALSSLSWRSGYAFRQWLFTFYYSPAFNSSISQSILHCALYKGCYIVVIRVMALMQNRYSSLIVAKEARALRARSHSAVTRKGFL